MTNTGLNGKNFPSRSRDGCPVSPLLFSVVLVVLGSAKMQNTHRHACIYIYACVHTRRHSCIHINTHFLKFKDLNGTYETHIFCA